MALSTQTVSYLGQIGELITLVDPTGEGPGPHGTVAYRLVPTGGWHRGERFPHHVTEDLKRHKYDKTTIEGVEYFLVPDESSNTPGTLSHYAQRTGAADLANPPSGGYNRARETFDQVNAYSEHTVAPKAVKKYVKENDNWEAARKQESEEDARVKRAISHKGE